MRPNNLWFGALLFLAVACGGEVDPGPGGSGGQPAANGNQTGEGGGGGVAAIPTTTGDPTTRTQLGDCTSGTPGSAASPASSCPWYSTIYGFTCYPTLDQACNCICPSNIISNCVPDWPVDGKPTLVFCSE